MIHLRETIDLPVLMLGLLAVGCGNQAAWPELVDLPQDGVYLPDNINDGMGQYYRTEDTGDDLDFLLDATYTVDGDLFTIEYTDEDGHDWKIVYRIQPNE